MTLMLEGDVRIEMERLLDRQSADLKEHFALQLDPIRTQTTKTNGRVGILEKIVWVATGAVFILSPMTYFLMNEVLRQGKELTEIRAALDE